MSMQVAMSQLFNTNQKYISGTCQILAALIGS